MGISYNFSLQKITAAIIITFSATVAQLVEQLIRNQQVRGSSPLSSSLKNVTEKSHSFFVKVLNPLYTLV